MRSGWIGAALAICLPGLAAAEPVTSGPGAVLRGLDKVSGVVTEIEIAVGQAVTYGRLEITLGDCRYPTDDPASDAYAWLVITEPSVSGKRFEGWMMAASPALNALDHPRYDVWVLRCKMAEGSTSGG